MKTKNLFAVSALALSCSVIPAQAVTLGYEVGDESAVHAHTSGWGLEIQTTLAAGLQSEAFSLDDGESYTFNFFSISTSEPKINWDDFIPRPISATLQFDVPDTDAVIGGLTIGGSLGKNGPHGGGVWWNDPVTFTSGNRTFSVALNNALFNVGDGELGDSPAIITATVRQIRSSGSSTPPPTNVPEAGSTLMLLGAGLGAMGLLQRRLTA